MEGFTSQVAATAMEEREALFRRVMPQQKLWDTFLGVMSVAAAPVFAAGQALIVVALLPSLVVKGVKAQKRKEDVNNSIEEGGSLTAIWTLASRAQEFHCGFGPDALAARLIEHVSVSGSTSWGGVTASRAWLQLMRVYWHTFKRSLLDMFSRCGRFPMGLFAYLQVRTVWLDDVVAAFAQRHPQQTWNLVILGAGYDTRCYRLPLDVAVKRYEVDAPGTQKAKLGVLEKSGIDPGETIFVSCDFATQSWVERLKEHGFDASKPSCFIWEGVTYYLPPDVVAATLKEVAAMASGSVIAFDFFWKEWCLASATLAVMKQVGERFKCALDRNDLWRLLKLSELECAELLEYKELGNRYLPKHPNGRFIDHLGDFGGFVVAQKL